MLAFTLYTFEVLKDEDTYQQKYFWKRVHLIMYI